MLSGWDRSSGTFVTNGPISLPSPRSRGRPGRERVVRFVDRPSGGRGGNDGIDGRAGLAIDENDAWTFRREVLVAPGHKRQKDGSEITPARGRHVFVARRMFAVAAALKETGLDQRVQPPCQH